jgi:hypothetical protein
MARTKNGVISDDSEWKKMKKRILAAAKVTADVGFFDSYYGPENDNLPVSLVAQWNEEGAGIPMRSFIRAGFIQTLKKNPWFNEEIERQLNLVATGKKTMKQVYSQMGPQLVKLMQEEIIKFDNPGNAPLTISLKGKDDPLRDSDTMLNSVEWQQGNKTTR